MPRRPLLTTRAHDVFSLAHDLADDLGHDDVTPVHLVRGLLSEGRSLGVAILHHRGVRLELLARELEAELTPSVAPRMSATERQWSASDEQLIDLARAEASELGTEFYSTEHLLLGFLRDRTSPAARVLARHGVTYASFQADVRRAYEYRPEADG